MKRLLAILCLLASPACAAPRIHAPKTPYFSVSGVTVTESAVSAVFTVTKSGATKTNSVVTLSTANGTALAGQDYASTTVTLTFTPTQTTQSVFVPIVNDTVHEGTETFSVKLAANSNALIRAGTSTGTITDDDAAPTVPVTPPATSGIGPVGERTFDASPGLANIPSSFDPSTMLVPSWGSGKVAVQDGDVVGAFRFICNFSQIIYDDPIVYPGQAGQKKSHLHIFFGNTSANGNSTYSSLRGAGDSTCETHAVSGQAANRSAYWAPAMLDGHGSVVIPDLAGIYYKRYPISDPRCSLANDRGEGNCVPLPNGLRYIFGYDMIGGVADLNNTWWSCQGQTAIPWNSSDPMQDHYPSLAYAATKCPTGINPDGSHNEILQIVRAPPCWDGVNLDSTNHRSHMAYEADTGMGYNKCPADHPYLVPQFQLSIGYTVDANLNDWRLSSDAMHPELPAGSTSHSDWFGAWDNQIEKRWMDACINKKLTCSGGDLGDGGQIDGAYARPRTGPRLVPVP